MRPNASTKSCPKADIWSLGIILAELVIGKPLWGTLKLGQCIRKVLSLVQSNSSLFERIAREHNCFELYEEMDKDLKDIIEDCLCIYPQDRPTTKVHLQKELFANYSVEQKENKSKVCPLYEIFTLNEMYHWWQLAGGDVLAELKKQGLIRSSPPILSLPSLVLLEGPILGQERNPATLFDPRVVKMPLDSLYQRFQHIPITSYFPLVKVKSKIISKDEPPEYDVTTLPLIIKERDPEYQFHRVILFRKLLHVRKLIFTQMQLNRKSYFVLEQVAAPIGICLFVYN